MGAAAGAARYTAARVHVDVDVDVRVDGGGDVEVAGLPRQSHREAACSTARQAECKTSSEALMAVLPDGAERVAEYTQ